MKKLLAILLVAVMILSLAGCKKEKGNDVQPTEAPKATEAPKPTAEPAKPTDAPVVNTDIFTKSEGVMTYAEYAAAAIDSEVTIETFIQDKQSWWDNKGTFYTQDDIGGYFLYNMPCTEEEYNKLVPGTKIRVKGYKSEWSGEVEIVDATYEILEGNYIAKPIALADYSIDTLTKAQNMLVKFENMTVVAQTNGSAFLYNWDGSGSHDANSDLYFTLANGGENFSFTVESYLRYNTTDVYAAVENLKVGDIVDVEGYVYWYNGPQPHVTNVTVTASPSAKSAGVMTYAEYAAAELDTEVTIETYVQAKQSWWDGKGTFYTQDGEGAYFLYSMPCTEEEYNKLVPGTKLKVTGYKSAWSGEVEIVDATYEIEEGSYIASATPLDVQFVMNDIDALEAKQNIKFSVTGALVAPQADGSAFLYNWDGSGSHDANSDLYFNVEIGTNVYSFTVESYLCNNTTDVYKAVEAFEVGDSVDLEGYLYWYNGPNPHITSVVNNGEVVFEGYTQYDEYVAAAIDSEVTVNTYVQAKQSWWDGKGTFYTCDAFGGYFLYEMPCTEEEYNKLVPGTHILVTGYKSEWSGEIEIIDATYEILDDEKWIADPTDLTDCFERNDEDVLLSYQNCKFSVSGAKVLDKGNGAAFLYKWDGSGSHDENSDLYFDVEIGGNKYTFTVESYLCDNTTDVYKAVENLKVGDIINMEGFLYWYSGVNPHITSVTK